jgi:hypothetical protein
MEMSRNNYICGLKEYLTAKAVPPKIITGIIYAFAILQDKKSPDSFPAVLAAYLEGKNEGMNERRNNIPQIVCLCGSTRFMDAFREANLKFTLKDKIVLSVGCDTKSDIDLLKEKVLTEERKTKLDKLHLRKIDLADFVYVLNVGGYIGSSTRNEINYALSIGKPVEYLEAIEGGVK